MGRAWRRPGCFRLLELPLVCADNLQSSVERSFLKSKEKQIIFMSQP